MKFFNKEKEWKFYIEQIESLNNNLLINSNVSVNGNIIIGNNFGIKFNDGSIITTGNILSSGEAVNTTNLEANITTLFGNIETINSNIITLRSDIDINTTNITTLFDNISDNSSMRTDLTLIKQVLDYYLYDITLSANTFYQTINISGNIRGNNINLSENVTAKWLNSDNISTNNLFMNLTISDISYNGKSFTSQSGSFYGLSVSISGNGKILIVSDPQKSSNGYTSNGEIIVYENENSNWQQRHIIYGLNGENIGYKTAINYDGTIIAFSNPSYNYNSGLFKVYKYSGNSWNQLGTTISGDLGQYLGQSIALNNNGTILAISIPFYIKQFTTNVGRVNIYDIANTTSPFSKLHEIDKGMSIPGLGPFNFGQSVGLSLDGKILAVGVPNADRVYIYDISSNIYIEKYVITIQSNINFGSSISLNYDGSKILIAATDIQTDGTVYLYEYKTNNTWEKTGNTLHGVDGYDAFGYNISINSDGTIIAIGSPCIYNDFKNGYVQVYKVNSTIDLLYTISDDTISNNSDYFGNSISLSGDGKTLAIGAYNINTSYIYNLYDVSYIEGEIFFKANNENISKINSTYDGNESTIKFSTINNSLLEDRLIINKEGVDINGNLTIGGNNITLQTNNIVTLETNLYELIPNTTNSSAIISKIANNFTNKWWSLHYPNIYNNGSSYISTNSDQNFIGAVLAPNGKIIFVPYDSSNVGIYDPITNDYTYNTSYTKIVDGAFVGGVLAPNGKIIFVPFNSPNVGIYDPNANTYEDGREHGQNTFAFAGGVLAPNGKIIFVPFNSSNVGIYDPITNDYTNDTSYTKIVNNAFAGGVLAPNGKIIFVPYYSTNVGIYDPITNTYEDGPPHQQQDTINDAFYGGVLAPNGKIIFVPFKSPYVGIYDPSTNEYTNGPPHQQLPFAFAGGVLAPNGKIIFVPEGSSNIGIYGGNFPLTDPNDTLTPYFNKF